MIGDEEQQRAPVVSDPSSQLPFNNIKYIHACTEMYLGKKNIEQIGNLDRFINLQYLYLNDNKITEVKNLDYCVRLRGLFLHNNRIASLRGSCLPKLRFLEQLNLSGNLLRDLDDTLHHLSSLTFLHNLDLFGNPLSDVVNYRYHAIFQLTRLNEFDCHAVTDVEKKKAQTLFRKPDLTAKPGVKSGVMASSGSAVISGTSAAAKKTTTLYDDLTANVQKLKEERERKKQQQLTDFYNQSKTFGATSSMDLNGCLRAQPGTPTLDTHSHLQQAFLREQLNKVFNERESGGTISTASILQAIQDLNIGLQPDGVALNEVLADWQRQRMEQVTWSLFSDALMAIPWVEDDEKSLADQAQRLYSLAQQQLKAGQVLQAQATTHQAMHIDPKIRTRHRSPTPDAKPDSKTPAPDMLETYVFYSPSRTASSSPLSSTSRHMLSQSSSRSKLVQPQSVGVFTNTLNRAKSSTT